MISSIFYFLAKLHGETGFDPAVAEVCNSIAKKLEEIGL